jgi:holo-[acyl-carrier protein] synthase
MIIGIGVDLINLELWRRFLSHYFEEFCLQCFSSYEIAQIQKSKDPFLAAGQYFAIKEAVLKAIGTGLKEGIAWEDVEVVTLLPLPKVCLKAACLEEAQSAGICQFLIQVATMRNRNILASAIASDDI